MATFTLTRPSQLGSIAATLGEDEDPEVTEDDTAGTTWTVYLAKWARGRTGAPAGPEVTTADADEDGAVTFTGLTAGTAYTAHASIGGHDQYVGFTA